MRAVRVANKFGFSHECWALLLMGLNNEFIPYLQLNFVAMDTRHVAVP